MFIVCKFDSFSSVQSLDRFGFRGTRRTIQQISSSSFFFSLQDAFVSSSGMDGDVHSLMMSIQHFLCRPRCRPPSKLPWRLVLERLSWYVTCPNHANFRLFRTNQKRLLWTHKEVDFARQPVRLWLDTYLYSWLISQSSVSSAQRTGLLTRPEKSKTCQWQLWKTTVEQTNKPLRSTGQSCASYLKSKSVHNDRCYNVLAVSPL